MLRMLIVDDDPEKTKQLTRAAASVAGVQLDRIDHAGTLRTARQLLRSVTYDLLILDLMLPPQADSDPDPNGGVLLLDELRDRSDHYRMPTHVIGVTQHANLRESAASTFAQSTLAVLLYDPTSDSWQRTLTAAIRHILAAQEARARRVEGYRSGLAVICALPLELEAVRRLPWNWDPKVHRVQGDPTAYYHGWYERAGERREVYAASAPRMGMPAAAVLATKMILRFAPEVVAMPGIAAGVRGAIEIGDVMVADPAWDYGSGKWVERDGIPGFETAPHQVGISPAVRTALTLLAEDALTLARIQTEWQGDPSPTRLQVRIGPVASGAAVLADRENVQRILAQNRKAIGVEMEAYGVYVAAQEAAFPAPEAVALKAVVDFADATKGDAQQRYGAFVSAASLRYLVERLL